MTVLYYLAVLTASFDVFLIIPLGFNFRASQLFLLPILIVTLVQSIYRGKSSKPLGFYALCLWTAFILLFVPNSGLILRSFGYAFWLVFNVFVIFATVQYFNTPEKMAKLARFYLFSFAFIATFGLLQFTLPILGVPFPLIAQWWIPDKVPRINGFSYEPSYFATYMLMGWCLVAYFMEKRVCWFRHRTMIALFLLLSLVMVLSSSRMGWLMMAVWSLRYPYLLFLHMTRGTIKKKYLRYTLAVGGIATTVVAIFFIVSFDTIFLLSAGLGFGDNKSHSKDTRLEEMANTLTLFQESPFIGHSLGGISYGIGRIHGTVVDTLELAKEYEGMNIFAEVLAASGIFGFIPFVVYMASIVFKPFQLAKRIQDQELRKILSGLAWALVFALMILQFNQTILRPYLWMHIAILSACYNVCRKVPRVAHQH